MQSLSRFLVVGISILTCGPLLAQSTATVAFPNNVARKVGLSGGEMAAIEVEVVDIKFGNGRRNTQVIEVIEFIGITESGAMIMGMGDLTIDEPKGKVRGIGDGRPIRIETGQIKLSALLVIHENGDVYEIDSGTLEFLRITSTA